MLPQSDLGWRSRRAIVDGLAAPRSCHVLLEEGDEQRVRVDVVQVDEIDADGQLDELGGAPAPHVRQGEEAVLRPGLRHGEARVAVGEAAGVAARAHLRGGLRRLAGRRHVCRPVSIDHSIYPSIYLSIYRSIYLCM